MTSKRVATLGYADDTVRKQFTGYERDGEAELDFASSRYFNYLIGRFSSPDTLLNSGRPSNPLSWNRYVYTLNNPLTYVDPTGFWEWSAPLGGNTKTKDLEKEREASSKAGDNKRVAEIDDILKMRNDFKTGLAEAKRIANDIKDSSVRKETLAGLKAYGKEQDGNNVTVAILDPSDPGAAATVVEGTRVIVAFAAVNSGGPGQFVDIAHEGRHVTRAKEYLACGGGSNCSMSNFDAEMEAYTTSSMTAQAGGLSTMNTRPQNVEIWNKSWEKLDKKTMEATRSAAVEALVNATGYRKNDGILALPGKATWH